MNTKQFNKKFSARLKRCEYAHLITEEFLQEGESEEWLSRFGGLGLGCDLIGGNINRRVAMQFGDLVLDILRYRLTDES